jgi:hypothetical protein
MDEEKLLRALIWFLNQPNGYIDGKKPIELVGVDDARLLSLMKAFLHPADVF